jgi:cytochrome o ubiquinol oxidase subunit IV
MPFGGKGEIESIHVRHEKVAAFAAGGWKTGVPAGRAVLAIAQMGMHLVFLLHITAGPDNTNNVLALAFGVLIVLMVLAGSLVIMADLNENLAAHNELMNLQMQH